MEGTTKIQFLGTYIIFLIFIVYMGGLLGSAVVTTGEMGDVAVALENLNPLNPLDAFSFFYVLMTVNTGFAILGTLIFTPLVIVVFYIVLEYLRGI